MRDSRGVGIYSLTLIYRALLWNLQGSFAEITGLFCRERHANHTYGAARSDSRGSGRCIRMVVGYGNYRALLRKLQGSFAEKDVRIVPVLLRVVIREVLAGVYTIIYGTYRALLRILQGSLQKKM